MIEKTLETLESAADRNSVRYVRHALHLSTDHAPQTAGSMYRRSTSLRPTPNANLPTSLRIAQTPYVCVKTGDARSTEGKICNENTSNAFPKPLLQPHDESQHDSGQPNAHAGDFFAATRCSLLSCGCLGRCRRSCGCSCGSGLRSA